MANTSSAKKAVRKIERRTAVNRARRSQMRTYVRKVEEARAVEAFERRLVELLSLGAKDIEMAMRWIHEAEQTNGDNDYLAWTLGLPYQYFKETA